MIAKGTSPRNSGNKGFDLEPRKVFDTKYRYSILITIRNTASTVRRSLDSILSQIDERFEVVIVDSVSTDGTGEILGEYSKQGRIKLIRKKCSRGLGRQIAFENSSGDYVLSNLDMDDIFPPTFSSFLEVYHKIAEGKLLTTSLQSDFLVAPREVINKIGGWRNINGVETWELMRRAAKGGYYAWTIFPILTSSNKHPERRGGLRKYRFLYTRYREEMRVGRRVSRKGEHMRKIQKGTYLLAKFSTFFLPSYRDKDFPFVSDEKEYFVDSSKWWPPISADETAKLQSLPRALYWLFDKSEQMYDPSVVGRVDG
jgi:glycosyltransferase involved in cell wall biosynthesis